MFVLVEVFCKTRSNNVLHSLAQNTGRRYQAVVSGVLFVTIFEERANLGFLPAWRNFTVSRDFWKIAVTIGAITRQLLQDSGIKLEIQGSR